MVDIDHVLQTELQQEDREVLAEDKKRWQRIGEGQHLSDWLGLRDRPAHSSQAGDTGELHQSP